jgi:hypothetical protein
MTKLPNALAILALLLCVFGTLVFTEVIRPFRDMSIDGPLAVASWGVGAAIGIACFFLKGRSIALTAISVVVNVVPLLGTLGLLWALSHTNFAWH